ncbi:MEDS domain-containing protein [Halopelagius longus]|uniref:histidine kinase n=1 Tax=Halopelagius longus TaxID=1236180 RepID=A0A1H0YE68_9EURY|nr:MEDS domain-containing protein [Halopelagius longus]RDI72435.1 PAS domain S-box protein [Halopelagius longus]SDQ13402.1 PAS domain S-box-containing protein [Halopelagius longus]
MSKHASSNDRTGGAATLEVGLEAFQSSPEFDGPVEEVDGHYCNDHFAHVYETPEEKFAAAVPFVRHGLDRGERILYVVDESTEQEVKAVLREGGIDVDAAVDSGALSFPTVQETYLRNGAFDADEMIDFYADTVDEATEEYAALRIVAEMTWVPESDTSIERFMEYEQKINELFAETESLAICQYNRDRFSPEAIRDVVRCHPHLIYDGAVCHNFYYTPPEEFFGEDALSRENDRILRTLRDRVAAKAEIQDRERFLRTCYEITADPDRGFDEKLHALFEVGCERFDMEVGGLAKVDSDTDFFEVEAVSGDHDHLVPGARADLSETYCRIVAKDGLTDAVTDPVDAGFEGNRCYREFGVRSYLGTHLEMDGDEDRTFWFVSTEPRDDSVSDAERTFVHLMGQWVKYELERRRHERELRERTEHLNAVIETTPECIKTVAPDGTLLQMNPAGVEMVEADASADVTGACVYDLIAPEDRERFREFNERICRGETGTLEFDIVGLEGTRRQMETHAAPLERPDGTTVQVAVTHDVTERKRREAELRQTKNRFETVFEQSDEAILIFDPDAAELVDANAAAVALTGYAREELLSLRPSDLHPDELESFCTFLEEVRRNGSAWSEDLHCRHQDGHDLPVEVTGSTITLDGRDLVLALVRNIEERKKHERYQRELYDIVADSRASFDEKLERLLELGRERVSLENGYLNRIDADAREFEVVAAVGPNDRIEPGVVDSLSGTYCERHLSSTEPLAVANVAEAELEGLRAHEEYGLKAYFATTVDLGADERGTLCFASESPREGRFTDAERSFLDLLGQCIGYEFERQQHERELKETIGRLQQSNERLERFAYAASHDLQEPLRMVTSYLRLIESRYADAFDEDGEEFLEFAVDGADRMREMIDGLLKYSRVETGGDPLEPVELDGVLEDALKNLQIGIEETDAEIHVEELPRVEGDAGQLRQVFQNLLDNALTYSGDEPPQVRVDAERRGREWVISVRDDGIGIDSEDHEKIFTVFDRLHSRDEYDGTGIGLALCERIVERHGGDIWVESEPGEGATFSVTLPAAGE